MQTWKLKKKIKKTEQKNWKPRLVAIMALVATLVIGLYDFPGIWNRGAQTVQAKTGWLPPTMSEEPFRLGLDLQGGTHLVYEADMSQIPEGDRLTALEGVRDVIERRVNAFGVSEPVVQTTTTGGTYRVIIELAGVLDVSEAIALIGETPVLEFKEPGEELEEDPTPEQLAQLEALNTQERADANVVLNRALAGEDFDALVSEFSTERNKETTKGILENITVDSFYMDYVLLIEQRGVQPGQVNGNLLENEEGVSIFKYLNPSEQTQMLLSHILICFEGKTGCTSTVSALDASVQINSLKDQATPENFADLAKQYSTDPSATSNSGDLGWSTAQDYVASFGLASAALEVGEISTVVETEFGYHLIYKRDQRTEPAYTIQRILMPLSDIYDVVPQASPWINTELSGKHLERAGVEFDPSSGAPYVALTFNAEGGELFASLTESHVGEPMAIFLDGEAISTPVVQQAIYGGKAVITGDFTVEEAKLLAQRLNAGALPVSVELLSQETVGPTLGLVSLEKSLTAAYLGFALVALFMIVVYRLPGLLATLALCLYVVLNLAAYRLFGVTVTLSGIAGLILSLGIAVDANVLIFERIKDEFRKGRDLVSSVDEGFKRAWPPIRDGHLTTLISACVLYSFTSSFVRGFALTLAVGVLLSLFTAITVTRVYMKSLRGIRAVQSPTLYGFSRNKNV
ncbi:protein translocase subunit SecD [Patescibacteria group bacterium]|nr:MAG: protein translocase subunit SecD [Patescibacteria group bacterium]